MSAGTDALKAAWRNFQADGIPASGANEPSKTEIRAGLDALAVDIAAAAVGDLGEAVALLQPMVDDAEDAATEAANSATAAATATRGVNMWPDPEFKLSAGDLDHEVGGYRLYGRPSIYNNAIWDAAFKHPYGTGAWAYDQSSPAPITLMGFETHFAGPGTEEFGLAPGDIVSVAAEVIADSGTVSIAARFFSGYSNTNYTDIGNQIQGSVDVEMDGTPKVLKVENLTIPEGAVGFRDYLYDDVASDFKVLRRWVVKGPAAGDSLPVRGTKWEENERSRVAVGDPHGAEVSWVVQPAPLYDAENAVLPVSGASDGTNNPLITGWASALAPAGVSFNAVRIRGLKQPSGANPLATVGIVVRKGAANAVQSSDATVVAVGTIRVNPAQAVKPATIIPLRDPATGAFITLSDAQLDTAEYAVMVYGLDALGSRTAIVQPRGVTDNQLGRTFYVTTGHPEFGTWSAQTTYNPVGVEHLYLDNLREGYSPTDIFAHQIAEKIEVNPDIPVAQIPFGQRLRKFRAFTLAREFGHSARYSLALVGDSWSTNPAYLSRDLAKLLKTRFGDGGVGWFGMGFTGSGSTAGDAEGTYYATRTGTWTGNYHAGSTSPNISDARSSEAFAVYQIRSVSGASRPALSDVVLHYTGTEDGVIRWRWGGGAYSADTPVQGTLGAQQVLSLTGFNPDPLSLAPANSDNLEIEVVSGSVILCGIDFQSADADGIVIHKLGSSGARASHWLTSDAAQWQAGIALLGLDGAQMLFGTNEDSAGQTPDQIAANYASLAGRLRTGVPSCDLLLAVAPENLLNNATDMTEYADAIFALVEGASPEVFAAFCDLQPAYGDPENRAEYASTGTLPLFQSDNVHPNATGAAINARELALVWESR